MANVAGFIPPLHDALHGLTDAGGTLGQIGEGLFETGHETHHGGIVAVDYLLSVAYLASGLLLVRARPENLTARLLGLGLIGTAAAFNIESHSFLVLAESDLVAVLHLLVHAVAGITFLHALVRFPDGRLPTRWTRGFVAAVYVVGAALLSLIVAGMVFDDGGGTTERSNADLITSITEMDAVFFVVFFGLLVPLVGSLAQRHRIRTTEDVEVRQQARLLRWALTGAFVGGAVFIGSIVAIHGTEGFFARLHEYEGWVFRVFPALFAVIPASLIVGILRYRLWDLDLVVNKTVVFGGLAGFVTTVYIGVVAGIGSLVGRGDEPSLLLSIGATAVVAAAFAPARQRLQRLANRVVYGVRATPYEVLSTFSERMRDSVVTDDILSRMAQLLAEGTGAQRTEVWLRVGDRLRNAAAWPTDETVTEPIQVDGHGMPEVPGSDLTVPVVHDGALLGLLTVQKQRGDVVTPMDERVVSDVASQAGLVLRNQRLTEELLERLEELRASRQRLVSVQDEERRRLERDLHDGAQQQIVAMKLKINMARTLAERLGADDLVGLLSQLSDEADGSVQTLRDLAHGIFPPLLESEGLGVALSSHARKLPLPVAVHADGIGRFEQDVEAAVYFCVLEALQNATKYAEAGQVIVRLTQSDDSLSFEVADDGVGFDPDSTACGQGTTNMADRLDALGGELTISSAEGAGTTVSGRIPVTVQAPTVPAG